MLRARTLHVRAFRWGVLVGGVGGGGVGRKAVGWELLVAMMIICCVCISTRSAPLRRWDISALISFIICSGDAPSVI